MPDRRQGDRREGGSKKITVPLSTFFFIVVIAIIIFISIIVSIVISKKSYKDGYSQAIIDMPSTGTYTSQGTNEDTKSIEELESEAVASGSSAEASEGSEN